MSTPQTYRKVVAQKVSRDFQAAAAIVEVPFPTPAPHEIVVRNRFAGVNASDANISGGVYFVDPQPPFDLGVEAAGDVVAVGSAVQQFKVGDHVITSLIGGGYREYYAVDASMVIPIAEATPEALTIVVGALTAAMALEQPGEMKSGETVLITAAAGGVGHFAVQMAKQAGNHVIGTCRSEEKAALLRELGCDRVINYQQEDLGATLKREYPNGVNLILESVGREVFDACVDNLAVRGRMVVIGSVSEYVSGVESVTAPRIYDKLLWKSASVRGFLFSHYLELLPQYLGRLFEQYYAGQIKAVVDPTPFVGVESVPAAVQHLLNGQNCGKVVVRF